MGKEQYTVAMLHMKNGDMLVGYGDSDEEAELDAFAAGKKNGRSHLNKDCKKKVITKSHGPVPERLKEKRRGRE